MGTLITMDKAQALQKVLDLNRLTASSTFDGEVEVSKAMATQLRSNFDISDEDIAVVVHYDEDFSYFGRKVWFFDYRRVDPYLKAIKENIDIVLRMVAEYDEPDEGTKLRQRAEVLGKFYRALRDLVVADDTDRSHARHTPEDLARSRRAVRDPSHEPRIHMVQGHYYVAVVAWYRFEVAKHRRDYEVSDEKEKFKSRAGQAQIAMDTHRWALMTMTSRDLTKPQVESIVGVHEDILSKRYWKIVEEEKGQS